MTVVAIANHKGGVGKSMTTQNLAFGISKIFEDKKTTKGGTKNEKKILLIDADPQRNLTAHCGISETEEVLTISDYLNDDDLLITPVQVGESSNLFLIPSSDRLDQDNINIGAMKDTKRACNLLKTIIDKVKDEYEYIFIDTAPGSGMLMLNALYASDEIIIPIADKDSLVGIKKILNLNEDHELHLKIRLLITLYDSRVSVNREIKDYLIENCPEQLFHTIIRRNSKLNEAANNAMDIFSFYNRCNGALDYMSLAKEFLGSKKQ